MSDRFIGLRVTAIPCGTYKYELVRTDIASRFGNVQGEILLKDTRQVLVLRPDSSLIIVPGGAISVDRGYGPESLLRGSVTGALDSLQRPLWVRLLALDGRVIRDVEISAEGTFEFADTGLGDYVLLFFSSERFIAARSVTIAPGVSPAPIEQVLLP